MLLKVVRTHYIEYNSNANVSDSESCINLIVEGCTDESYLEYEFNANTDNGSCITEIVLGCTDQIFKYYGFGVLLFLLI